MFYPEIPTAEEIKALRVKHGLENYQAAALINVSLQTWWRYENGDLKPSVLNWALFLNAVGELALPPENPLTPFAFRALSFVPPVALKSGNAPESYVAPTPEQITKLREEAKLTLLCNILEIPAPAIVPKSNSMMPPRMAWSMLRSKALTLPMRENTIPVTAAMRNTTGAVILVKDMAPVTSE